MFGKKRVKCPYCAELIQADAVKCKHCGEWKIESIRAVSDSTSTNTREEPQEELAHNPLSPEVILQPVKLPINEIIIADEILSKRTNNISNIPNPDNMTKDQEPVPVEHIRNDDCNKKYIARPISRILGGTWFMASILMFMNTMNSVTNTASSPKPNYLLYFICGLGFGLMLGKNWYQFVIGILCIIAICSLAFGIISSDSYELDLGTLIILLPLIGSIILIVASIIYRNCVQTATKTEKTIIIIWLLYVCIAAILYFIAFFSSLTNMN